MTTCEITFAFKETNFLLVKFSLSNNYTKYPDSHRFRNAVRKWPDDDDPDLVNQMLAKKGDENLILKEELACVEKIWEEKNDLEMKRALKARKALEEIESLEEQKALEEKNVLEEKTALKEIQALKNNMAVLKSKMVRCDRKFIESSLDKRKAVRPALKSTFNHMLDPKVSLPRPSLGIHMLSRLPFLFSKQVP